MKCPFCNKTTISNHKQTICNICNVRISNMNYKKEYNIFYTIDKSRASFDNDKIYYAKIDEINLNIKCYYWNKNESEWKLIFNSNIDTINLQLIINKTKNYINII